ncbi:MAG: 30S ribosomal protein S6 [Candidatus Pacebacteria bacterium]|nr:30S ribosomal protein S6 [Candidatus Paceibacterota bacterium]MDD5721973.1 30S ribosomal protein S6 [Candidatus Paceibacterota bacterium]
MVKKEKNIFNYELTLWLSPEFNEKEAELKFNSLLKELEGMGAIINVSQLPQLKPLGYPIRKSKAIHLNAYFAFIQFGLAKNLINALQKKLNLNTDLIRFIIVRKEIKKTIKISPSTFKKSLLKSQTKDDLLLKEDKESKETLVDKKPETEISVEELDKKLNEILNK